MEKRLIFGSTILLAVIVFFFFLIAKDGLNKNISPSNNNEPKARLPEAGFTVGGKKPAQISNEQKPVAPKSADIILEVPYVNEAPSGFFGGQWKNACEEASIAMVDAYYAKKLITIAEAENFMRMLFKRQDILYGSNANSDAARTAEIINKYSSFGAVVKQYPTLEDIKKEINAGRPVITPNYGFGLKNPDIPFLGTGSSYHMEVIIGYNDVTKEFITNDSGDIKNGIAHRYDYELFMGTVRDYDYTTNRVDGPARAIFTFSK